MVMLLVGIHLQFFVHKKLDLSLTALGMKLQSDLLGPVNIRSQRPPPDKFVECMTGVGCLKLFHKHNYHFSEYANMCVSIHSPYFDDIDWPITCYGQ